MKQKTRGLETNEIGVACMVLLLTACNGGNGGPAGTMDAPVDDMLTIGETLAVNRDLTQNTAAAAGNNLPVFGSVTQSSNVGSVAGITGDVASVSFDGTDARLTVSRPDGSRMALNTETDTVTDSPGGLPGLPGQEGRSRGLVKYDGTSFSAGLVAVVWDGADPTDYLAGGYWMHYEGTPELEEITGAELGAFVDGPELSGQPTLPNLGTASYHGSAGGLFATEYGTDAGTSAMVGSVPAGSLAFGEFRSTIDLTADFTDMTISGCVGCGGNIQTEGFFIDGATGEGSDFAAESQSDVHLGPAPISEDGSFRNHEARLESPGFTVTHTTGAWGGQFSSIPGPSGNPRLVAGTFGGTALTSGGTKTGFIGSYYGGLQEESGPGDSNQ